MQIVRWIAEAGAWGVVGVTVVILATQALGWSGTRLAAVAQALTPVLGAGSLLAAIAGRAWSNPPLTIAGLVGAAGSALVVVPALRRRRPMADPDPTATVRVFHANLLFDNTRPAEEVIAAVLASDADVLALSELHRRHEKALLADPAAVRYPYRVHRSATNADGLALWSRFPLEDVEWVELPIRPAMAATVCLSNGSAMRVVLAHPNPPTTVRGLHHWEPAMVAIDEIARRHDTPTIIVADLNAARWHPPLRRLLARGWSDAHEATGRGLSVSWPTTGRWPIPFVRLDHALIGPNVDVLAVDDVAVPGSDHRGFVVTVAVGTAGTPTSA